MPLYEYYCDTCKIKFEQIVTDSDEDAGKCPKCKTKNTEKLISTFKVGGRGDLRESTMHGCHEGYHGPGIDEHGHKHDDGDDSGS